ncbi:MAG: hypothetical protein IJS58_05595 [Bacilli bacterium]|nr:hypothetical protein [Bacilli bacterium]
MKEILSLTPALIGLLIFFGVLFIGYALGRIKVKGIALGTSGVFILAIVAGCVLSAILSIVDKSGVEEDINYIKSITGGVSTFTGQLSNVGLALFITSVGFTAGPTFIQNFKSKAFKYIIISVMIIFLALGIAMLIYAIDKDIKMHEILGIMMGAMTSTPGLSSNLNAFPGEEIAKTINAVNAIAYPFGVLGVCFFVQLTPRIMRVDMKEEVEKIRINKVEDAVKEESDKAEKKMITLDRLGLGVFSLAVILGIIVGALTIPGIKFKLTLTGGSLIVGLLFGHFKKIGRFSLEVPKSTLKVLKELGLAIFLACSGLSGGLKFIENVQMHPLYFFYGALITFIPMLIVFIFAKFTLKMELLNILGAITGGMTSTPALGALIEVADTDDVGSSYTSTYPFALFLLVLIPQILKMFV